MATDYSVVKPIFKDRKQSTKPGQDSEDPRQMAIRNRMKKLDQEQKTKSDGAKAPFKY